MAEQLLRNGASVCICDVGGQSQIMGGEMRDGAAALEQRRDELAAATGGDCMAHVCDVTNLEQIDATMAAVEAKYGRLDILANVAGIGMREGGRLPFREARLSDWQKVIDIDLTGPFRMTQAALPLLDKGVERGGSARVINIASVVRAAAPFAASAEAQRTRLHRPACCRCSCRQPTPRPSRG